MKPTKKRQGQILPLIHWVLIIFLILLGLLFISGTIYGVFFNEKLQDSSRFTTSHEAEEGQTFTGIGTIRVSTADTQPAMVIIFVSFIYYPQDKAFSEELALRVKDFRQIIRDYFSSLSVTELHELSEDFIKAELLNQFNADLRLGQLEALFFSDFIVVE